MITANNEDEGYTPKLPAVGVSSLSTGSAPDEIASVLDRLAKYGNPTLIKGSRGWWCCIDIHVTAVGAKFEIKSESDHKFPAHAALECESRMMTALRAIGAA
jgi:hypothetical protein